MNRHTRKRQFRIRATILFLAIVGGNAPAKAAEADRTRNWSLELGLGVAYAPDYSGARSSSARLRIWADGTYRTNDFGTFALDSGSLTVAPEIRWDFVDSPDAGIGPLVGYRAGRNDRNPSLVSANDGSDRLSGLPDVSDAIDAGVAGHATVLGVPVFAQVRSAVGGPQGVLVIVGLYLPFEPAPDFELTILPTLTWANARQMRALYGVTPASAVASGFAPYDASASWENAAIEIGGDCRISGSWHVVASAAYQHLLGSAAHSSIVQTASQSSALIGIAFHF